MAIVIALGIAVVVVGFVVAPFFLLTGKPSEQTSKNPETSEDLAELLAEKETIYAAIQELDFDLKSGKLSPEDHEGLRKRHETQAATVLKRIDALQGTTQAAERSRGSRQEKRKG